MKKILIIQTAFIGDVILATGLIESLHKAYPDAKIDFLLRRGNESLFKEHPFLNKVIVWEKQSGKIKSLLNIIQTLRRDNYDLLINLQRFFSSGLISWFARAQEKRGFDKNPFSFSYHLKLKHEIGKGHETERNFALLKGLDSVSYAKPKLYPTPADFEKTKGFKTKTYVCMAPASVWFTKQLPLAKWVELIKSISEDKKIFLIGAPSDSQLCNEIALLAEHSGVENLCGKLSLTASAALMKDAEMNYVNDSAPLHLASAVNAPVTAFFCSTVPSFGFGPLSDIAIIQQVSHLDCRPCGLHGYRQCPRGDFRCGYKMEV
ncbi:MAG: glycosyltransferase family 9 protein [Bacteroidetes bacterium]|nr:Lipopolysaccharide core heptosyltransferase RfaQ [Bacteroidia bacterium]MCB0848661.1 glycosyltransferase family 9 protein [Bacteroidota bacterium]MCE7954671.1 glycosyltransferase family 9 protein [Bacteroidetes bacterium CHB6]MCO5287797.1 glycosyltransferase family 9 protein [Bacteroidota bacterium]MCW5931649.1 glycosyltransferase family 9 protein [Bacteroidota bacterium]